MMLGWHRSQRLAYFSYTNRIEPAPYLVQVQSSTLNSSWLRLDFVSEILDLKCGVVKFCWWRHLILDYNRCKFTKQNIENQAAKKSHASVDKKTVDFKFISFTKKGWYSNLQIMYEFLLHFLLRGDSNPGSSNL